MVIMRQRSPSPLSFHPDPDSGLDDLDVIIIKNVEQRPGITILELADRMLFYNAADPSDECRPKYAQIWYRVNSLEKNKLLSTRREPSNKAMERRCYSRKEVTPDDR